MKSFSPFLHPPQKVFQNWLPTPSPGPEREYKQCLRILPTFVTVEKTNDSLAVLFFKEEPSNELDWLRLIG